MEHSRIFSATHARALVALARYAEAQRELLPARERIVATFGPRHARSLECTAELAKLYTRWGRPREAARWREASRDTLDAARVR